MNEKAQRSVLCLFPEKTVEGLEIFRQKYILHPGKAVPFHVTLLHHFYLPEQIDETVISKLTEIAQSTLRFDFQAKPLSGFPSSKVLYLTPSPATPIEELSTKLYAAFPDFHHVEDGFPVFHMTIALGNPEEDTRIIVNEYFDTFGRTPLALKAGKLGVYAQFGNVWQEYLSVGLS